MSKYNYDDWDDDFILPYKSKKKKRIKKSDHKHNYEDVIARKAEIGYRDTYLVAKQCSICGKTEITNYFPSVKVEGKPYSRLFPTLEEMLEMYPNLRVIDL